MKISTDKIRELDISEFKEKYEEFEKSSYFMMSLSGKYFRSEFSNLFDISKIYKQEISYDYFRYFILDEFTINERLVLDIKNDRTYILSDFCHFLYPKYKSNNFLDKLFTFINKIIYKNDYTVIIGELSIGKLKYYEYDSKNTRLGLYNKEFNKIIYYSSIISLNFNEKELYGTFKTLDDKEYFIKLISNEVKMLNLPNSWLT